MEKWVVYKITRSDNMLYIGKTKKSRIKKRMYDHKRTERFKNFDFDYEIIFESDNHNVILEKEKSFIEIYDSYNNGLNKSIDGSGNHNSPNFHTVGFVFSKESKEKMSKSHKERFSNGDVSPMKGKKHSEETRSEWSKKRKGKVWSKKFDQTIVKTLMLDFINTPVKETIKSKNGRNLTHVRKFSIENSEKYNMCSKTIHNILTGKTLVWAQLYKEIIDTKF